MSTQLGRVRSIAMCFPLDFTLTLCAEIDPNLLALSVCGKVCFFLAIFICIKTTDTIPTSPCIGGHSVSATEML